MVERDMNRHQSQSAKKSDAKDRKLKVTTILFDLDGTIFDIVERDAFARYKALNELGHRVSLDEVRRRYRYGIGRMGVVRELGIKFTEKEEEEYIQVSFVHFMTKEAYRLTKIHNGAYTALSNLSKRFKLVIVTSRDTLSSTEDELEQFSIRKFFSLIITRDVAARYYGIKEIPLLPFQEQRTKLCECAIGLTKTNPKDMLCVGDSVGELEPAKRLGIKTIGVLTGFSSKEDMEKASIRAIQDLAVLARILN
jgi:phosphoglycolate phosphatase-like HAD superfamily hydrolase